MKMSKAIRTIAVIAVLTMYSLSAIGCGSSSKRSSTGNGNYNKNDSYYSNNDSNKDGNINDKEFQNAVGDWMDDHGY